jgi:hypothetical protein
MLETSRNGVRPAAWAVAVEGVNGDQRHVAGRPAESLERVSVHLGRRLPLPDVRHTDHLIDESVQSAAVEERLGAQAHDRQPGVREDVYRRFRVGLGGQFGEAVEHVPDLGSVRSPPPITRSADSATTGNGW